MHFSPLAVLLLAPLGTMASQVNLNVYSFFTTYIPLAFLALSIKAPLSSAKTYNRPSADSSFDTPQPTTATNCQQYAGSAYPSLGQTVGGPYGSQSMLWVSATDRCYDTCGRRYRTSFFYIICIPSSSASVSLHFPLLFFTQSIPSSLLRHTSFPFQNPFLIYIYIYIYYNRLETDPNPSSGQNPRS